MTTGHIKLGAPGELRDYLLVDPKRRVKSLANPMAAKLGSGLGGYDDMQNWAGFLMEDWQAGIGKKDPSAGGSLYSTAETRFPNRLLLSYAAVQPDTNYTENYQNQPGIKHPTTEVTVTNSGAIKRISQKIKSYGGYSEILLIYLKNEGVSITVEAYADSGGKPTGSALTLATITTSDYGNGVGYSAYMVEADPNLAAGTAYHIVIYPTSNSDTIHVPVCSTNSATNIYFASWSTFTAASLMVANLNQTGVGGIGKGVIFASTYYFARNTDLCKVSGGATSIVHTFANAITDIIVIGTTLYIGFGSSLAMYTMSTSEVFTVDGGGVTATLFAKWNGYLWRSLGVSVYYTGDGATWTQVDVADTGETIYALAGVQDYLYVATNSALYYVGAGDQVRTVTPWPNLGYQPRLLTYQGALYVAFGESIVKYDGGTILPIGPDLGEGLPAIRDGFVTCMASSNYWFFIGMQSNSDNGRSTIWAWNAQGWHHICTLPGSKSSELGAAGFSLADLCYDRYNNVLWANDGGIPLSITVPDVANYNETVTVNYAPQGWLETDWFFGGLHEIYKDCESVYLSCDVCDSNRYVEIYWQDDDSTTWELLGTATALRSEIRWSDYTTRPNTRQIKLAFALYSKTVNTTPIIRAIRLKFMTMVQDRYRWSLPIAVSDNQQMVDGRVNPYSALQMRAHLETLITRVPPCIYQDVDGTQYEVKILSASEQLERWEYSPAEGQARMQTVYSLQVEQATTGTYSG